MATRTYDVEIPKFDGTSIEGIVAEFDWVGEQIQQSIKNYAETGSLVGYIASFQIADGYAWYRVESVKPLKLAHIPAGDGYQIPDAHLRGLRVEDIKQKAEWDMRWRRAK